MTTALRPLVTHLQTASSALAVLGSALHARLDGSALPPARAPHVHDVLRALGLEDALAEASDAELAQLLAEIKTFMLTDAKLIASSSHSERWAPSDRDIMQSAGDVTASFPDRLERMIAPELDGLLDRLASSDACFLDVGTGVGALSIHMARKWPRLRVVGIDTWAPALRLARENVRASGHAARITLREQAGETLTERGVFDLAWVPTLFIPEPVLLEILRRVRDALRPAGWLLLPILGASDDPLTDALGRARVATWGGSMWSGATAEHRLREAGFEDVRAITRPDARAATLLAARVSVVS